MQEKGQARGRKPCAHMDGHLSRIASATPGTTTRRAGAAVGRANLRQYYCSRGNEAQRWERKRDYGEQVPLVLLRVDEQLVPRAAAMVCRRKKIRPGKYCGTTLGAGSTLCSHGWPLEQSLVQIHLRPRNRHRQGWGCRLRRHSKQADKGRRLGHEPKRVLRRRGWF